MELPPLLSQSRPERGSEHPREGGSGIPRASADALSVTLVEHDAGLRPDAPPSPDLVQQDAVAELRAHRLGGLSRRERVAVLVLGGGFLATAVLLALLVPTERSPSLVAVAGTRGGVRARLADRVRARQRVARPDGAPARADALRAAARLGAAGRRGGLRRRLGRRCRARAASTLRGSRCGSSTRGTSSARSSSSRSRASRTRAGATGRSTSSRCSRSTSFEFASCAAWERFVNGLARAFFSGYMARSQLADAALAPVGLAIAFAAPDDPLGAALALPLVALLSVFARERRCAHRPRARALGRVPRNGVPARRRRRGRRRVHRAAQPARRRPRARRRGRARSRSARAPARRADGSAPRRREDPGSGRDHQQARRAHGRGARA